MEIHLPQLHCPAPYDSPSRRSGCECHMANWDRKRLSTPGGRCPCPGALRSAASGAVRRVAPPPRQPERDGSRRRPPLVEHQRSAGTSRAVAGLPLDEVEKLLDLYGVTDPERDQLLSLARDANQRGWWEEYADVIPDEYQSFIRPGGRGRLISSVADRAGAWIAADG